MLLITGGLGFIGWNTVLALHAVGKVLCVCDDLAKANSDRLAQCKVMGIEVVDFRHLDDKIIALCSGIIHLGAISSTVETDANKLDFQNTKFSINLFDRATAFQIPIVLASSAATYGDKPVMSDADIDLQPLNLYAQTKHKIDQYCQYAKLKPPSWACLKFFNVYGPGEDNKTERTSSLAHKAFTAQKTGGVVQLFKSSETMKRDFVYVKDAVRACCYFLYRPRANGIYNVGTGTPRSFYDIVHIVRNFSSLLAPAIETIDMPEDLLLTYQHFSQSTSPRARAAGFHCEYDLERGLKDMRRYF